MEPSAVADEATGRLLLNPKQPCHMAAGVQLCWAQHQYTLTLGLPTLIDLPGYGYAKPWPIAVAGGGPSLAETVEELRAFKGPVLACGSAHDHLVRSGVKLTYCAVLDPDPLMAKYLSEDAGDCIYLVASHVAPQVFYALRGKRVFIFGAGGTFPTEEFDPLPVVMAGGRTVGTRGMGLALALGFSELHLFGMDSCVRDGNSHAYSAEDVGTLVPVYCGSRKFMCAGYMLGQAMDFQHFCGAFGNMFALEVHGDGLIYQIVQEGLKSWHVN